MYYDIYVDMHAYACKLKNGTRLGHFRVKERDAPLLRHRTCFASLCKKYGFRLFWATGISDMFVTELLHTLHAYSGDRFVMRSHDARSAKSKFFFSCVQGFRFICCGLRHWQFYKSRGFRRPMLGAAFLLTNCLSE